ncbi:MAG: hypothetical protein ABL931_21115, partial [Usitatibacteraceae bacterium]
MNIRTLACAFAFLVSSNAMALYDPKPLEDVSIAQGEWRGTLTYNDYSRPGKLVTLPTRLFAAMASPTELVLQYIFDDGPA